MPDTRQFEDPGSNILFLSDLQDHCHESVPFSWAILYKPSCDKSSLFKYLTKLAKPWRTQSTQAKCRNQIQSDLTGVWFSSILLWWRMCFVFQHVFRPAAESKFFVMRVVRLERLFGSSSLFVAWSFLCLTKCLS